jgi:DNA-binding NtrC family response regulator
MQRGVLFISPRIEDAAALTQMLAPLDVPVEYACDLTQARSQFETQGFSVVLTEAFLPDGSWLDVLELAREARLPAEVIVTHPFADSRFWAEALSLGAYDLLAQPFHSSEVQRIIANACTRPSRARVAGAA